MSTVSQAFIFSLCIKYKNDHRELQALYILFEHGILICVVYHFKWRIISAR